MLLPSVNNDQNIIRLLPKMNENFQHENNKLPYNSNSVDFNQFTEDPSNDIISKGLVGNSLELTPTNCKINGNLLADNNCQTADFEVKSLKEWLILHNDLIQQQNEEIIEKDQQIYNLQKENEMLKERLISLENAIPLRTGKDTHQDTEKSIENLISEDMTPDACLPYDENPKEQIEINNSPSNDNIVTCPLEINNYEANPASDEESQVDTTIDEENLPAEETEDKREECTANDLSDSAKTESDTAEYSKDCLSEYNFTINNITDPNSENNIKMSICRKKINSSSVMSSEPVVGEKETYKRIKRKRKRVSDNLNQIITTKEPYVSGIIEENSKVEPVVSFSESATLEVPRWRIKHYTSCYTMEGTENLDDEVFNKRHMRLEIDERRRKRWDIQRIREQRVIEKLKQRQDRKSNTKTQVDQKTSSTLLPNMEDIKYIEITDDLPVSAFGHPIPKLEPSPFTLPWLDDTTEETATATSRRKSTSRRSNVAKRKRSRSKR